MIRIGSDTDIGMNWNSSDWLVMNSYPILSPGKRPLRRIRVFRRLQAFKTPLSHETSIKNQADRHWRLKDVV